jgi:hypothetical protein
MLGCAWRENDLNLSPKSFKSLLARWTREAGKLQHIEFVDVFDKNGYGGSIWAMPYAYRVARRRVDEGRLLHALWLMRVVAAPADERLRAAP